MSAEELAEEVGATKAQILAYENGHAAPDPLRIRALASALRVRPIELTFGLKACRDLGDLRRANGYRLEDVVRALGVSPKVLRKLETEGIPPLQRPNLISEMAELYEQPMDNMLQVVRNSSGVRQRVARISDLLARARSQYIDTDGVWAGPRPTEPLMGELAELTSRSTTCVTRVVGSALAEEKSWEAAIVAEGHRARLDPSVVHRRRSDNLRQSMESRRADRTARLPGELEAFLRSMLPASTWQGVRRISTHDGNMFDLADSDSSLSSLPDWMVHRFVYGERQQMLYLTELGQQHVRRFGRWYGDIYPHLHQQARRPGPAPAERRIQLDRATVQQIVAEAENRLNARARRLPKQSPGSPVWEFARELRGLWAQTAPPLFGLATRTAFTPQNLLSTFEGRLFPDLPSTLALVEICGGDQDEWRRKWLDAHKRLAMNPKPGRRQKKSARDTDAITPADSS